MPFQALNALPTDNQLAEWQQEDAALALRLIADSSVVGIFKTRARHLVWANTACTRMLGYDAHDLIGQPTRMLYPDDAAYEEFGRQLYADEGLGELACTAAFVRKNGRLGWYVFHARRLNRETDELIGLFVDVTHIKELEETLRQSNDQLELALNSSGTGTWTFDFREDRFTMDFRTAAIFGFESEQIDLSMASWLSLIHPEDLPRVQSAIETHMGGDTPYLALDYRARHQHEGHWVSLVAHGKVYWDSSGALAFGSGIVQDVSEIKRLKETGADLLHKIEMLLHDFSERNEPGKGSARQIPASRKEPPLSNRHREVLALIATGLTSAQIAERLNISHATVLTHRRNLLRKLDLHSVADLTRYAVEHKIVPVKL